MSVQTSEYAGTDDRVYIDIETTSHENMIRRRGRGTGWKNATLEETIARSIGSHEEFKEVDFREYQREHSTVDELQQFLKGQYHVVVNDRVIAPSILGSVRLGEVASPIVEPPYGFGIRIRVEKEAPQAVREEEAAPSVEAAEAEVFETAASGHTEPTRKTQTKYEALKDDLREWVDALPIAGLFVGNLMRDDSIDPRVFEFLPGKRVNDLLGRANRMLRNRRYRRALETYQLFSEVCPQNADYRFLCGRALCCLEDYPSGLEALKAAVDLGHEKAHSVIESILSFREKYGAYPPKDEVEGLFL